MKLSISAIVILAATTINILGVCGVRTRRGPVAVAGDTNATLSEVEANATESASPAQEIPPEDVFMLACNNHLTTLVDKLRASYTHVQIPTVLAHWCMEENYTHRFGNETICNEYSLLLEEAHVDKLNNASDVGSISNICKKYYDEEMVAKADSGAWLWAKGEDVLPKFEEAGNDNNETAASALDACTKKMKTMMVRLQNAYTYNQLPMMLMNACQGHQKFDSSAHKKSCQALVTNLMKAHESEVEGKAEEETEGYAGFCKAQKLEDGPLLQLIAFAASPTAPSRQLRIEGLAAAPVISGVISADTKQLMNFLVHPHGDAPRETLEFANLTSMNLTSSDALPPLDDFLAACLTHTKALVKDLSEAYTTMQLPTVLEHACEEDEDVHKFEDQMSCKDFADRLVAAEASGDQEAGYTAFCKDYYVHKGGVIGEEKPEIKTEKGQEVKGSAKKYSLYGIIAILAAVVVLVVVGTFLNLKNSGG